MLNLERMKIQDVGHSGIPPRAIRPPSDSEVDFLQNARMPDTSLARRLRRLPKNSRRASRPIASRCLLPKSLSLPLDSHHARNTVNATP